MRLVRWTGRLRLRLTSSAAKQRLPWQKASEASFSASKQNTSSEAEARPRPLPSWLRLTLLAVAGRESWMRRWPSWITSLALLHVENVRP